MSNVTTDTKQQQSVEEPVVVEPSRAEFDFQQPEAPTNENLSDLEQRLQSLDIGDKGNTSDASTQIETQQSPEAVTDQSTDTKQSDLPDLSALDLPEDLGMPESTEVQELPDTPEAKKFAEDFQKYLGFSVEDFRSAAKDYQQTINYINQVRQEQYVNESLNTLSKDWGVGIEEAKSRLSKVQERYNKYGDELRAQLDSVEGAKLIWAKLEQEAQLSDKRNSVPQFQKSRGMSATTPRALFTKHELSTMSKEEYARNADKILYAYQNGLVK